MLILTFVRGTTGECGVPYTLVSSSGRWIRETTGSLTRWIFVLCKGLRGYYGVPYMLNLSLGRGTRRALQGQLYIDFMLGAGDYVGLSGTTGDYGVPYMLISSLGRVT